MADNPPVDITRSHSDSENTLEVDHPATVSPKDNDAPPDGGYGWVCVACNFFINGHTWGVNSSYGVFLSYYLSHNYFPNTSALAYAFIGGLSISQAVLIAPLATRVIHSYGTRVCLHCGVFFETLSLIGASFATQKYQIILAQGICFGWGMGFLFVGTVGIIPQWFLKKRSVANAIAASGSGLGGLMYSLVTQRVIDTLGLPWAFRVLGIATFVVNLTASNLLRDRNRQVGSRYKSFDVSILKRPEFLFLQGWSFFSMLGYTVVLFSLPSYATTIGLTPQQGSILSAILNLGQMLGRPFIGLASDRYGRLNLATLFSALCGLFCFAFWIPAEVTSNPMGLLLFFAIVGGALAGTFWATIAPVGAEVVGLQDLPAALSLTWVLMVPPTTVAEPIALELRRRGAHSWVFLPPQIFTGAMYLAGAICLWVVRGWKVGEMEEWDRRQRTLQQTSIQPLSTAPADEKSSSAQPTFNTPGHPDLDLAEPDAQLDQLERLRTTRSASVSAQGWNRRDLLRRMFSWKIV